MAAKPRKRSAPKRARAPKGPPTARRRDRQATRARILEAAEELLGARGFDGVGIRDVAERARCNVALLSYYFKNKAGLFAAVLERYYDAQHAALEAARSREGSTADRVGAMIEAYIQFIDTHRAFPRLVQQEVARGGNLRRITRGLELLSGDVAKALEGVAPVGGPLAAKQFVLSFAAMTVHYYSHAAVLRGFWGEEPLGETARADRLAHLRWVAQKLLVGLLDEGAARA
jgi:AcrR family transcriptional regulator